MAEIGESSIAGWLVQLLSAFPAFWRWCRYALQHQQSQLATVIAPQGMLGRVKPVCSLPGEPLHLPDLFLVDFLEKW